MLRCFDVWARRGFLHTWNRLSALGKDQYLPPGSSGSENIFAIDARAQPVHGCLGLSERISQLEFTCVYPPKPDPSRARAGIAAPALSAASRPRVGWCSPVWGERVPRKADWERCGKRPSVLALLTSLWKRRWGQPRQAWHLETTLIKSNFLILEGRETRSDSLLATALQF